MRAEGFTLAQPFELRATMPFRTQGENFRAAGKAPGFLTSNEADARRILEIGGQFVAVGSDLGVLARGVDALAAKFKG